MYHIGNALHAESNMSVTNLITLHYPVTTICLLEVIESRNVSRILLQSRFFCNIYISEPIKGRVSSKTKNHHLFNFSCRNKLFWCKPSHYSATRKLLFRAGQVIGSGWLICLVLFVLSRYFWSIWLSLSLFWSIYCWYCNRCCYLLYDPHVHKG